MFLGIELGSTRIKGVIIDLDNQTIASSSYRWQSSFEHGYWTYNLDEVWLGIKQVILDLNTQVPLKSLKAMGVSAMMHGLLAFDEVGKLLTPFRTWKNTNTEKAASELSHLFNFNIPLRWSIAHLYQTILDQEPFLKRVHHINTLAGYVHECLTGQFVIGIGDASGMFPVDLKTKDYDEKMLSIFKDKTGLDVSKLLPKIVPVGADAGTLTEQGSKLLGTKNILPVGLLICPPEGDAQTGMVSTNSIKPRTGNVSAGTSVFSMVVLERPLSKWYPQIDIVQTPIGDAVAMVHANECTSLIDPFIALFGEAIALFGKQPSHDDLYQKLYEIALKKDSDLGKFMKDLLVKAIVELKEGMDILTKQEGVCIDFIKGHGGYFQSGEAGAKIMSETLGIKVEKLSSAGEGGPWGMALLAGYRYIKTNEDIKFDDYLNRIFKGE